MVTDYIASSGSNELSVNKGQQVEIIEPPTASEPDFCLVRLNPQHDDSAVQEGLVPVSVLKPPPGANKQGSSGSSGQTGATGATVGVLQKSNENMQDQGKTIPKSNQIFIRYNVHICTYIIYTYITFFAGNRSKADALSSSTKRRGFSG